jgi:hypothetical protein
LGTREEADNANRQKRKDEGARLKQHDSVRPASQKMPGFLVRQRQSQAVQAGFGAITLRRTCHAGMKKRLISKPGTAADNARPAG